MSSWSVIVLVCLVSLVAAVGPSFPEDWTSKQHVVVVTPSQKQEQQGVYSFALSLNKTRWDDVSGQIIVSLYGDVMKTCLVNTAGACQAYCPLQNSLAPLKIDDKAVLKGQGACPTLNEQQCDQYEWQTTLGPIPMETTDLYVLHGVDPGVPVSEFDLLTPFGQQAGNVTTAYTDFKAGTPDPSLFKVTGVDECPKSPNCGDDMWKLHMLRMGQRAHLFQGHPMREAVRKMVSH